MSDPIHELMELLGEGPSGSDQSLSRIISRLKSHSDEGEETGWSRFRRESKAQYLKVETRPCQIVIQWLDSWFRVVLTGVILGAVSGFLYRWIVLSS